MPRAIAVRMRLAVAVSGFVGGDLIARTSSAVCPLGHHDGCAVRVQLAVRAVVNRLYTALNSREMMPVLVSAISLIQYCHLHISSVVSLDI